MEGTVMNDRQIEIKNEQIRTGRLCRCGSCNCCKANQYWNNKELSYNAARRVEKYSTAIVNGRVLFIKNI
jgi:hypothetical protein